MATTSLLPVLAAAATPRARPPTRLNIRRAAPAKRTTAVVARVGDDEIQYVVNAAAAVPPDVSPEDFNAFYRLLDSADAEQVEAKVKALVEGGGLTEGVLKAAFATLEQAQSRKDDPQIVASLQVRFEFDAIRVASRRVATASLRTRPGMDRAVPRVPGGRTRRAVGGFSSERWHRARRLYRSRAGIAADRSDDSRC
jgi:hypothetical protein